MVGRAGLRALLARRAGCDPLPFEFEDERLGRPRLRRRAPVSVDFNTAHSGEIVVWAALRFDGSPASFVRVDTPRPVADCNVLATLRHDGGVDLRLVCRAGLYDQLTLEALAAEYRDLLRRTAARPDASVGTLLA